MLITKEEYQSHYKQGSIEPIDFILAHDLDFCLGNVIKYICRSPYKGDELQDLIKARDYLEYKIISLGGNK